MNLDPTVLLQFIKPRLTKLSKLDNATTLTQDDLDLIQILASNYLEALENPLPDAPVYPLPAGAPTTAAPDHRLAQTQVVPPPKAQAENVPHVKHTRDMNERNAAALERARRKADQSGAPPPPPFSGQDGGFADEDIPVPPPGVPSHPAMAPHQTSDEIQFAEDGTPIVRTGHLSVPPPGSPGNPLPDQQT